ncbi:AAA family ATPase [Halarcobacter sp.]|uniref:AAA family ATPase n=1 Tax=Halarcobacter sp. TaxID=2321133 RepID=UPI002AA8B27B|nr:AAA family ATPase [Halarcobacter sp.]
MTSLEFCHELEFSKINFIERKFRITHPKTILLGAPKVGKSFLIFDYLSNFESKEYLYIDFDDYRNDKEEISQNLEEYVFRNNIKVIVLENFSFDIKIPFCDSVIITSKLQKDIKGYKTIKVSPLDFEEYLLHDKRNQNITHNFNSFLKYGNLPQTLQTAEFKIYKELQNIIKIISEDKTSEEILKILIFNIDEKKSLNQLYLSLKSKMKISKDKFYEQCKKLEENFIIYFISKYNQEKAVKKIFLYNSAFFSATSYKKKFKNEFTNIIFQELLNKREQIFYLDYIDFYIPKKNIGIVSIPFFNSMLMQSQLKKIKKTALEYNIKELNIITVSNNENINSKELTINVLPFYEWSLS